MLGCEIMNETKREIPPAPTGEWSKGMAKHLEQKSEKKKFFPISFEECTHLEIRRTVSGLGIQTYARDIELSCYDCGAVWDVHLPSGKKRARIKFREIRKSPLSKDVRGVFVGCRSSDDYDEIHLQVQDPIIEKYPIAMFPAIAIFQKHNLKKEDKISFTLNEEGWVDLKTLKILERAPKNKRAKYHRRKRLEYSRQKRNIQRAAIYDETIGWYKDTFGKKKQRIRWTPVKKGPKGAIWILGPGFASRRYITKERFEVLKTAGKISIKRPPDL